MFGFHKKSIDTATASSAIDTVDSNDKQPSKRKKTLIGLGGVAGVGIALTAIFVPKGGEAVPHESSAPEKTITIEAGPLTATPTSLTPDSTTVAITPQESVVSTPVETTTEPTATEVISPTAETTPSAVEAPLTGPAATELDNTYADYIHNSDYYVNLSPELKATFDHAESLSFAEFSKLDISERALFGYVAMNANSINFYNPDTDTLSTNGESTLGGGGEGLLEEQYYHEQTHPEALASIPSTVETEGYREGPYAYGGLLIATAYYLAATDHPETGAKVLASAFVDTTGPNIPSFYKSSLDELNKLAAGTSDTLIDRDALEGYSLLNYILTSSELSQASVDGKDATTWFANLNSYKEQPSDVQVYLEYTPYFSSPASSGDADTTPAEIPTWAFGDPSGKEPVVWPDDPNFQHDKAANDLPAGS